MAAIEEKKIEALQMAGEYLDKLIPSMEQVVNELKGQRQDDTIDFLMQIIDGLNFMLETYNAVEDIINGKDTLINNDVLEESVQSLSSGFAKSDYTLIANELSENILPFLKVYREAANRV